MVEIPLILLFLATCCMTFQAKMEEEETQLEEVDIFSAKLKHGGCCLPLFLCGVMHFQGLFVSFACGFRFLKLLLLVMS